MVKTSITDTRVRVRPSRKLLQLVEQHKESISEIPENFITVLKANGYNISNKIELINSSYDIKQSSKIDLKLLRDVEEEVDVDATIYANSNTADEVQNTETTEYLYLSDLRWLNQWLTQQRVEKGLNIYLHNLIEDCSLELPKNEEMERNPVLEARCQRLREQQQNQEYLNMTKNVDSGLKHIPDDTLAYQVKAMNTQMIAVLQFIFSVAAGFVFGFLGLELIFGGLKFGLRLVLGIFCALVVAVAEMYFLVKKLNEEDKAITSLKKSAAPVIKKDNKSKPHQE
ncbi:uncharacterized protein [Eurosta solidaginis]|uniref:uncharacterized protein n=1 Tax=Eurosta solidaginis TaxID=178769 RepID=UPI00353064E6